MKPGTDKNTDLWRATAAVMAALACMVMFIAMQPVNLRNHNTLLGYFSQLQRDEAQLGEAVLQLYFNLSNNYDQVTAISTQMRDIVYELRHGEAAEELRKDAAFQRQLTQLEQQLPVKLDALEKFKSSNSVLKNSLAYLPHLRDRLKADLQPGQAAHEHLDNLIELAMLHHVNASMLERGQMETSIALLEKDLAHFPANKPRKNFDILLRHAHLISQLDAGMLALTHQLASTGETELLGKTYHQYYDRQLVHIANDRNLLLLTMLTLLGYAIYTVHRWREKSLQEKSRHLKIAASVFESQEGMVITDANQVILRTNRAFSEITGYSADEVLGKTPHILKSGRHDKAFYSAMWDRLRRTGKWQGEIWNRRKNGELYPEWLTITMVKDEDKDGGAIVNYVGTLTDITDRKRAEDAIKHLAFYDPLTRLPNRRLLQDRLQQSQAANHRSGRYGALLFIDLDNFKTLNDTLGHNIGDLLLQQVAQRLTACVREIDTVSRLGGDEFVVILEDMGETAEEAAAQARVVGEKALAALNRPYQLDNHEHRSTPSIGITLFSDNRETIESLLKQADSAMYQAKTAGRNALRFYAEKNYSTPLK